MKSKKLLNNVKVNKLIDTNVLLFVVFILIFLGIPADEQRLTLGGISLDDELTLNECHVEEESTLYVLLDLEGGGKKRKKKSYNTPKKNKHKRKKVKLAVLKYYKVKLKK